MTVTWSDDLITWSDAGVVLDETVLNDDEVEVSVTMPLDRIGRTLLPCRSFESMNKLVVTGGALWAVALVGSFQLGRSQTEDLEAPSASIEKERSSTPVVFRGQEAIDFIKGKIPDRADISVHDELWLTAEDWASREPAEAVAWMNKLEFDDVRNPYLFAALSQWARQDPERALVWLEKNSPENEESEQYLKAALIRGMARNDVDGALAFLLKQPKNLGRSTVDFVLGAWVQEGAGALIDGIGKLPDHLKLHALEKAASHLSPEMLAEARGLSEALAEGAERTVLQTSIANRWAAREPKAALAWAAEQASPEVVGVVAKHWARQEPLEASRWLEARQDSPEYDLSARAVAWSVVGIDPEKAFSQVAAMKSEPLRLETFEQLGRFWISDQPMQARGVFKTREPSADGAA